MITIPATGGVNPTHIPHIEDILSKARHLSDKLRTHDDVATDLLLRCRALEKRENAVDELQELLHQHSEIPFLDVKRVDVVRELEHESLVLRALRQENVVLSRSVQENEDAIRYIMDKYHQHAKKLCDLQRQDELCPIVLEKIFGDVIRENVDDLESMVGVIQTSVQMNENFDIKRKEFVDDLTNENLALRRALKISRGNPSCVAGDTQTDTGLLQPPSFDSPVSS